MALAQYDFKLDAGADWQKIIRLRDGSSNRLVGLSDAVMEIRNANYMLILRLDAVTSRCTIMASGTAIQLHITAEDSLAYFQYGNYPGAIQAVGIWGIGRSYFYDLFVTYDNGVQDRIMRGFFYVDPNITQQLPASGSVLPVSLRGR